MNSSDRRIHADPYDHRSDEATVLIVDDDANILEFFSCALADNYEIKVARSGSEALSTFDTSVDVVLLNRSMPGMIGDDVLTKLRQREVRPLVAIVSGRSPDLDIIDLEFDDYLEKPVSRDQLLDVVDDLLRRKEYSRPVRELFALDAKIAILETSLNTDTLRSTPSFDNLIERRRELERDLWTELGLHLTSLEGSTTAAEWVSREDQTTTGPGRDHRPSWTSSRDSSRPNDED